MILGGVSFASAPLGGQANNETGVIARIESITPLPIAVVEATFIAHYFVDFASITPIPTAIVVATHTPFAAAFASVTPVPICNVLGFHPYNEGSELNHNTVAYTPLVRIDRNIVFTGRPL